MRRPALTLLLVSVLTFFVGLGRQAITDADEGFYAEAAREMVERGDWLTPHFNYEDRWQKPVLYYWLTALLYLATGPTEFAARFWSALSGLGLVLLTWIGARRAFGRDDVAWLAGAMTATCYGYVAMARMALPDLPLTFCVTLGIWAALERRWTLAGAAAGLGFLVKGPVALVVPALVLLPIWWKEGTFRALTVRDIARAAAVFAAVGLPWYVAMTAQHGPAYLDSFFVGDNLERFATDRFNAPRGVWFYVPIVIGGMLPWSVYLVTLPARSIWRILRGARALDRIEWRLLIWAGAPLLFFTLSVGKQPRYILPVLPPLAMLLARSIGRRVWPGQGQARPRADAVLAGATWITAALFGVAGFLLLRARPVFIQALPGAPEVAAAGLAAAAVLLGAIAWSARWDRLPHALIGSAVVLFLAVQFGALSGARPEPVEAVAALIRAHRHAGEPVGHQQVFVRNLSFYTGLRHESLVDVAGAAGFLSAPHRVLLVAREDDVEDLEARGVRVHRLGAVRYLNAANVRLRTLFDPDVAEDLETVLLVANR